MNLGYSLVFLLIFHFITINNGLSASNIYSDLSHDKKDAEGNYNDINNITEINERDFNISAYSQLSEIKKYKGFITSAYFLFGGFKDISFLSILNYLNNEFQIDIQVPNIELWKNKLLNYIAEQTLNNSNNNYNNFLSGNDNTFIDLHDKILDLAEVQALWQKVDDSDNVGHIIWGNIPEEAKELKDKIESKIVQNNKQYKRYPNDFIHALLSAHVYKNHQENEKVKFDEGDENKAYNNYLEGWEVYKAYDYPESGGYYSIAYINKKNHQLVLAHRGTTVKWEDLINKDSPLKVDLKGILGRKIVAQQAAAYRVTKQASSNAKELDYNVSTTGHSLGAWLAELSLYFCYRDFSETRAKAVTFDSPGAMVHMNLLESNVINNGTEFDIKNLDIVTYLSAPNFVNSCNKHIGKVYRLFPNIENPELAKKISKWSNWLDKGLGWIFGKKDKNDGGLVAIWSIFGHSLNPILAVFDPGTGKPKRYEEVLDWPVIQYTPKETKGQNLVTNWIDSMLDLFTPKEVAQLKASINDSTIMTLLSVLSEVVNGKMDQSQYLRYFAYISNEEDNLNEKTYQVREKLSDNEEFSLRYEGHYRSKPINLFEDILADNNRGSADWYLKELRKANFDQIDDELSRKQLRELKEQYTITPHIKNIISSPNIQIDVLREWILRLIKVNPSIKLVLENPMQEAVKIATKDEEKGIASYLPEDRPSNFIEIGDSLKRVEEILNKEQYAVISGLPGGGQSYSALEYAYRQKNKITGAKKIVRWFLGGSPDKIWIDYKYLASELGIADREGQGKNIIINLVNNKIDNLNTPLLFIFDNIEKLEDIKDYLINLPQNVKVLITTCNDSITEDTKQVKLKPFNRQEAILYLQKSLGDRIPEDKAEELIKILGTEDGEILPYRLSQAVAYIKNNEFSDLEKCIRDVSNNEKSETELLMELVTEYPLAWKVLQYAAYLDKDFISVEVFKELLMVDEEVLKEPIRKLTSLSLMRTTGKAIRGLKIEKLVQEGVIRYAKKYSSKPYVVKEDVIYNKLIKALNNLLPKVTKAPSHEWKITEIFYPHVTKVLSQNRKENIAIQGELYTKLGRYNEYVSCDFKQALAYEEEGLRVKQAIKPNNYSNIAKSLSDIGWIYCHLGDTQRGLIFHEQALKTRREYRADQLSDIGDSLNSIGWFYQLLGDAQKGLGFHKEALEIFKQLYSQENHPKIASTLNYHGWAYRALGDSRKALESHKKALQIYESTYQENHPEIARSLSAIGEAYLDLGKIDIALTYHEKALKMRQEMYRGDHPDIAASLNNMGLCYDDVGNTEKMLLYYEQALKMRQNLYKGDHPDIARSLNNVGWAYEHLGEVQKALGYYQQALRMKQELYHGNHPDIARALNNIGGAYEILGELNKALEFKEQALKMRQEIYSVNHPKVAVSLYAVGEGYKKLGDIKKALLFHERALKMRQELYKDNHPDIIKSMKAVEGLQLR